MSNALIVWNVIQGVSTVLVAWLGWRIQRRQALNSDYKTRLDLYDRRYKVWQDVLTEYQHVAALWDELVQTDDFTKSVDRTRNIAWTASFLFKDSVGKAIHNVATMADRYIADFAFFLKEEPHRQGDSPDVFKHKRAIHRANTANLKSDLDKAVGDLAGLMMPYLDFRHVGEAST